MATAGEGVEHRRLASSALLVWADAGGQRKWHRHEVLPAGCVREARQHAGAKGAAERVRRYAMLQRRQEAEEREEERRSRWYNKTGEKKRSGWSKATKAKSKSKSTASAPKRAKKRVAAAKRRFEQQDRAQQRAEQQARWYLQNKREPAADAVEAAKVHARDAQLRAELGRAADRATAQAERDRIDAAIERVLHESGRAFAGAKQSHMHELLLWKKVAAFSPGPYLNPIESVYAVEACGLPRRLFNPVWRPVESP